MQRYIDDGEHFIDDDLHDGDGRKILRVDVVANDLVKSEQGDTLKRSSCEGMIVINWRGFYIEYSEEEV